MVYNSFVFVTTLGLSVSQVLKKLWVKNNKLLILN